MRQIRRDASDCGSTRFEEEGFNASMSGRQVDLGNGDGSVTETVADDDLERKTLCWLPALVFVRETGPLKKPQNR